MVSSEMRRGRSLWYAGVPLLGVLLIMLNYQTVRYAYEVAAIHVHPDAQTAYNYGEEYFNAQDASAYNIQRAAYFLTAARNLDPNLLYVDHELARIDFLRGHMDAALHTINLQIEHHGSETPNSYYVRGLIEGYRGEYDAAATDYEHYLAHDSKDWAAMNDYAWVLLKAGKPLEALIVTTQGLATFANNPWLLNSNAIALYELGKDHAALSVAESADRAVQTVSVNEWLTAYPGNDPRDAIAGIDSLQKAATDNVHMIAAALATSTIQ